jgi:hypothetical protein
MMIHAICAQQKRNGVWVKGDGHGCLMLERMEHAVQTCHFRPRKIAILICTACNNFRSTLNLFTMLWRVSKRKSHQYLLGG